MKRMKRVPNTIPEMPPGDKFESEGLLRGEENVTGKCFKEILSTPVGIISASIVSPKLRVLFSLRPTKLKSGRRCKDGIKKLEDEKSVAARRMTAWARAKMEPVELE
jgi:hypothetical protein